MSAIWAVEWSNADGVWTFHHATTSEAGAKLGIERLRHKSGKEIKFRTAEYAPAAGLSAARAECGRLRAALLGCIDSLEYVDSHGCVVTGYAERITKARQALEAK